MAARGAPAAAPRSARTAVARAATLLLDGVAGTDTPGLIVRGWDQQPRTAPALAAADPALAIAADGLLALARLSEAVSEGLHDHVDADVRRSAAVVAARAYPLLAALASGPQATLSV